MRIEAELFRALRVPMAVAAVLLAASAALGSDAWSRIGRAEAAEQAREAAAADLQRNANALRGERENAVAFGARFVELEAAGAFEPHSRPLVIDRLEAALEPWRAQVKRYTLGVPGDAVLPGIPEPALHKVRTASLTFEMTPRHEGSFIDIVDGIVAAMPGMRALERCQIGWAAEDSNDALKATCTLSFYSFERRSEPVGGLSIDANGMPVQGAMR